MNFNDPSGHEPPDATKQSTKVETDSAKATGIKNPQSEEKLTEQPKKVGDEVTKDAFKFTLDIGGLGAVATDKAVNPKLGKVGEKAIEEWGLILTQPEFKIAGKILSSAGAALDAESATQDVFEARNIGFSLSNEEKSKLYWDIAIGSTVTLAGAILEGPTITLSSSLLAFGALKVGTATGKLINSGLPAIPDESPRHINPREKIPDIPSQRFPGGYF
ncbi:MAG: hypothetical protein N2445_07980 [Acidobacteria bacterium]|nr:hypothetical protein [Acidobacteriota bacterium]